MIYKFYASIICKYLKLYKIFNNISKNEKKKNYYK